MNTIEPHHVGLTTTYLGMELVSPVVASAGPVTGKLDTLRQLEAAGIGGVVLPSLFEEQLRHEQDQIDRLLDLGADSSFEATGGYLPELDDYNTGPRRYLAHLEAAKLALTVPVVASLNGTTRGGWTAYARQLADAGADAIELNVYRIAADPLRPGRTVEQETLELVAQVVAAVEVPVSVKLHPAWSALGAFARELTGVGAQGLVLFNRMMTPDLDLASMRVVPMTRLSTSAELHLGLTWIGVLSGRVTASLAATTGVHTHADVLKVLLAGGDVAMMTSALLRHGPGHVADVLAGVRTWMAERGYFHVDELRGAMSQERIADPESYERLGYVDSLTRFASTFV